MNNKEIQCHRVTEVLATRCDRRQEGELRGLKSCYRKDATTGALIH